MLCFLFAVGSNGSRKWAYKAADSNLYAVTPAIDASGNIYFGHRGKKLIVLSPAGDIVKEIALDVEVLSGMSLSKDGTVYFGSSKNTGLFSVMILLPVLKSLSIRKIWVVQH